MATLLVPRTTLPSAGTDYARSIGESKYPDLYERIVGAWLPIFGQRGGSGTSASITDYSKYGNHAISKETIQPSPLWAIRGGKEFYGLGFRLDGSANAYCEAPSAPQLAIPSIAGEITIESWVICLDGANSTTNDIASMWNYGAGTKAFVLTHHSNNKYFFEITNVATSSALNSTSTVTTDLVHVCATWKAGLYTRLFVNGIQEAEDTTSIPIALENSSTLPFTIGSQQDASNVFNGYVFGVIMRAKALGPSQIRTLYEKPFAPFHKRSRIFMPVAASTGGRIMSSLAYQGGLAGIGGIAGRGGGLAG